MNRINVFTIVMLVFSLFTVGLADEITPDQMRRLVSAELKTNWCCWRFSWCNAARDRLWGEV